MRVLRSTAVRLVASVALGLLLLGAPVLVLQAPPVTRALVARFYDPAEAGLPLPAALAAAEAVRAYTTDAASPPLPAGVGGRAGFDESAASHLRDVRRVLELARAVTLASAAVLALGLAFALPARRYRDVALVLRAGAIGTLGLAVLAGAAGAIDFDTFFGAFHGLLFAAGTWTFPTGTLLIELFPEPLWATLGALWAGGVLAGAVCALVVADRLFRLGHGVATQDV